MEFSYLTDMFHFCKPLGGTVVCKMDTGHWAIVRLAINFSLLFPNQWLHDSCLYTSDSVGATVIKLMLNPDTSCRVTSNCRLDRPLSEPLDAHKNEARAEDSYYTLSHIQPPFPKSKPGGDLHHCMSSAWSAHSTLHAGPSESTIQMIQMCCSALCLFRN